ncbi:hypothetical protein C1637_01340 [Chryseobacterium lactis]|uniref:Peptidase M56 domain-containing protein n=1 Tax=Chryseobacterium lactis TaxID=1241981 RepID=A0A3G6RTB5_CHRLC|nr:M56 family metallopeptidase [Chryseobacterium lactis]AZA81247.1 hypothetical protein EG342_04725 [Chryseobacterium lactis]AZB06247.1 hypothetical protein EG341_20850 [Chryseobacterium lactis]PNW15099.1 hypothetical protein C1637_01340 [Chryseobacterium lactis]
MIPIILKIILCSSIFIAVYYLFLEKEKMYRFNRFYLLSSLILSYIIPFITITLPSRETVSKPRLIIEETTQQIAAIQTGQSNLNWLNIIGLIYIMITLFLLVKSIAAILKIKKIKGEKRLYQDRKVVLTTENLSPFSFWNTIYMGRNYVKDNTIDPRIFLHEKGHLDQKHSIDLVLIDFFKIFTWFNPVIFLYKRAMIVNHEFLADEVVLQGKFNVKEYQKLILEEIINNQNLSLTHSFNFNNTKKRFTMMNAKKTKFGLLRKTAGITVLITAAALFSEKMYATEVVQTGEENTLTKLRNENVSEVPGAIPEIANTNSVAEANHEKVFNEKKETLSELKTEKLITIPDTIAPKAKTENNEGKNTNTSVNSNANENITQPEFPGGPRALREKIGKNMNTANLTLQKGVIKSVAYVHIDATGKTTDIKVSGDNEPLNRELLKTITDISNEITWKPGTQDGKAVASVLKIPATMSFEPN